MSGCPSWKNRHFSVFLAPLLPFSAFFCTKAFFLQFYSKNAAEGIKWNHLILGGRLATWSAWYKCQNNQNAQKCLRRVRMVFSGLQGESPKRVCCKVRNTVLGCFPRCKTGFARCERLFWWDSWHRDAKSPLALLLSIRGHFGCFDTCARPTGLQGLTS